MYDPHHWHGACPEARPRVAPRRADPGAGHAHDPAPAQVHAADGKLIWSDTRIRRDYIKYKDIPQSYIDLLLSTEDKDFYQHSGFSGKGIANAGLSVAMSVIKGGGAANLHYIHICVRFFFLFQPKGEML